MILILHLLNDPLAGFVNKEVQALEKALPDTLILDNFSDRWLVKKCADELWDNTILKIIILRDENAGFNNLLSIVQQIPQHKESLIIYSGNPHPLIDRLQNIENVKLEFTSKENIVETAKKHFKA